MTKRPPQGTAMFIFLYKLDVSQGKGRFIITDNSKRIDKRDRLCHLFREIKDAIDANIVPFGLLNNFSCHRTRHIVSSKIDLP